MSTETTPAEDPTAPQLGSCPGEPLTIEADEAAEPNADSARDPIMRLLTSALERQSVAAETTASEVRDMRSDLKDAIHSQSDRFEAALRSLSKPIFQLAALTAVLMASIAGVQFYAQWSPAGGVTISTVPRASATAGEAPEAPGSPATVPASAPAPATTATAEPAGPVPPRDD